MKKIWDGHAGSDMEWPMCKIKELLFNILEIFMQQYVA